MAIIDPSDFRTKVFVTSGKILEANGQPSFAPGSTMMSNVPRTSTGAAPKDGDIDAIYTLPANPLSFSVVAEGPIRRRIQFGPPGVTDKMIYLPYFVNNISATTIPTGDGTVRFFMTDQLSGCNFFIDRLPNGDLVCYHANAKRHSSTEAQLKADASAYNPLAPIAMDVQHSAARLGYPGAVNVATLRVADYYANAQAEVDRKVDQGRSNVTFYGGTTIMGFRVAGRWEFWFQTYAQLDYERSGLAALWKGKQVTKSAEGGPGGGRYRILDARRFWP